MIVDSSALIAILHEEVEAKRLIAAIGSSARCLIPASCLLEATIVMLRRQGLDGMQAVNQFLLASALKVEAFTASQARLAQEAYLRFGKGRHPAQLNFGDCMAYAAAKETGEELLFKGSDFSQTDIAAALY